MHSQEFPQLEWQSSCINFTHEFRRPIFMNNFRKIFVASDWSPTVDDGMPHAVILNHAEEWAAALVVMGSHGEVEPGDALLGSVTNNVLRHAHCPVLIVRPGERSPVIIAGTDFSDPTLPAVRAAA